MDANKDIEKLQHLIVAVRPVVTLPGHEINVVPEF
jgi:hypothetical protein